MIFVHSAAFGTAIDTLQLATGSYSLKGSNAPWTASVNRECNQQNINIGTITIENLKSRCIFAMNNSAQVDYLR